MRKLILLSAFIFGLSAYAQKQVIATYDQARQVITVHYFANQFGEATNKISIPIAYLNGVPVANPYFSSGACQSMQLSKSGEYLYFFLTDRLPETAVNGWSACFVYDFKTKTIKKLFSIPKQSYLIWHFMEERNSVIYYSKKSAAFIEKHLDTKPDDILAKLDISPSETYLEADSNNLLFYGMGKDKIYRWQYNFHSGKSEITPLTTATHFCGAYQEKLLLIAPDSVSLQCMVNGTSKQEKIPYNAPWMHWLNKETFCVVHENFIRSYNTNLQQLSEYEAEKPYVTGPAAGGLLIGYVEGNQRILVWLGPGFGSEKRVSDIKSHTVYMVSELP